MAERCLDRMSTAGCKRHFAPTPTLFWCRVTEFIVCVDTTRTRAPLRGCQHVVLPRLRSDGRLLPEHPAALLDCLLTRLLSHPQHSAPLSHVARTRKKSFFLLLAKFNHANCYPIKHTPTAAHRRAVNAQSPPATRPSPPLEGAEDQPCVECNPPHTSERARSQLPRWLSHLRRYSPNQSRQRVSRKTCSMCEIRSHRFPWISRGSAFGTQSASHLSGRVFFWFFANFANFVFTKGCSSLARLHPARLSSLPLSLARNR